MTISGQPSKTDWERVKREYEAGAPVTYDPNDPDDGPYDPNDDKAVDSFLTEANRVYTPSAESKKIAKAS